MAETTYDDNNEGQYVPKSYQFERDMDREPLDKRVDNLSFSEDANEHFTYVNINDLLDNLSDLKKMIDSFLNIQRDRLDKLDAYSKGANYTILNGRRRIEANKADYRIAHNWGGYISNFITGYMGSIPIEVTSQDEATQEAIDNIKNLNDLDNINYELMFDSSRSGRGYEIHYRKRHFDGSFYDAIRLIPFKEMFVIRDKSIDREIIAAMHLPEYDGLIEPTLYTDNYVIHFKAREPSNVTLQEERREKHFYQMVPVVEWWNNRFREGDWENEIPLIDAYDSAQSDTANYMSDLNDAALVVSGDLKNTDMSPSDLFLMAQANIFLLESGMDVNGKQTNVDAKYIYKEYDEPGTEAYKNRIIEDLHKLVNIPNMTDEKFGTQSGIAIQYKLIGLQQMKSMKVNYYSKALRRRYQIISNVHKSLSDTPFDPMELTFTFHENIPQDVWTEVSQYIEAGGEISQESLRELTTFLDNDTEEERLSSEGISPDFTDFMKAGVTDDDTDTSAGAEE